ncbi:hypothetical protein RvY_15387 [Ramazzottius varieornatus]|uniref:Tetraspanin n=1 Tax=Ramazzottius varieornatus TaxID=947166 RepID=A0A1D1VUR8_RAMVA|nr:hypothetical protein RvY_15387 [Ramazzottius varieornatus]
MMARDMGGPRCAKYSLYGINIVIIILACVTLGVGIWISSEVSHLVSSLNPSVNVDPSGRAYVDVTNKINDGVGQVQTVANLLITSGVFAILIGVLGIWAAYRESRALLITYAVILIIIVLLEIGAGIAWAVDRPKLLTNIANGYENAIDSYDYVMTTRDVNNRVIVTPYQTYNNNTVQPTIFINLIQTWVGCCGGRSGYTDFQNSPYWAKSGGVPPVYCCKMQNTRTLELKDPGCINVRTLDNSWMEQGCAPRLRAMVNRNTPTIIGVAVGIAIVDLLGIGFAFYQYRLISEGYRAF